MKTHIYAKIIPHHYKKNPYANVGEYRGTRVLAATVEAGLC
jgi:hypothetical protein